MIRTIALGFAATLLAAGTALAATNPTAHPTHAASHATHAHATRGAAHSAPADADHSADQLNAQSLQRAQGGQ